MAEYKGLTVEFRGDATSLSAALATIQRDASAAQSQLTGIDKALKNSSTNGRNLNEALKNNRLSALGRDAQAATERLESLRRATPQLESNLKKASDKFKAMGTQEEYVANVTKKNSAAIAENNKQIEVTQRRMEGLKKGGRAYKSAAEDVEKLQVANKQLNDEIKNAPVHWNNMRQNVYDAQRALDRHTTSVLTAESASKAANAEFNSATRIAANAKSRLAGFGDSLISSGVGLQAVGKGISDIGDKLSLMSVVAAATFGKTIIGGAEDFGNRMSQVGVYLDTNAQGLSEMKSLALETGKETIFSAGEAAHAISELAKGGLTEAEIKAGALHATMSLAAAGQMNFAEAADTTVRAMRAFGLGADHSEEVADALAGVAARSTAEVTDLSQGFVQVAAMAHNAGWSIQETSAAIGVMADHGFSGAMAGTALKVMLQRLTAPTDKAKGLMEELGIEVRDSSGHMKSASDVIKQLNDAFYTFDENGNRVSKYSDEVRDAALSTLFGTRGINAALSLMEGGSDVFDQYADAASRSGSAAEMAQGQLGDLGWSFELLRGEAETAAVNIGERLTPTIKGIADTAEHALEWFDNLDEGSQSLIAHMGLMAVSAGPLMSVGGRAITGIGKLGKGLGGAVKAVSQFSLSLETAPTMVDSLGDAISAVNNIPFKGAGGGLEKAKSMVEGLKGGLAGMAAVGGVALVVGVVSSLAEMTERANDVSKATDGMRNSFSKFSDAVKDAGKDAEESSKKMWSGWTQKDYDASFKRIGEHVDNMQKTADTAATSIGRLNKASEAIKKYANSGRELNTHEQGEFIDAIKTVNELCGTQYSVMDSLTGKYADQSGEIQTNTDSILGNIEARKKAIEMEAYEANIKDAYAAREEATKSLTKAQADYNKQLDNMVNQKFGDKNWMERVGIGKNGSRADVESYLRENPDSAALDYWVKKVDDAKGAYDAATDAIDSNTEALGASAQAASDAADAYDTFLGGHADLFSNAFNGTNKSIATFRDQLRNIGADTEALNKLSAAQLADLATSYDGTTTSLVNTLSRLGVGFDQAAADSALGIDKLAGALGEIDGMADAVAKSFNGMSLQEFATKLHDAGVSVDDLKDLTLNDFSELAANSGGDIDKVIDAFKKLKDSTSEPAQVNAEGNLTDGTAGQKIDEVKVKADGLLDKTLYFWANGNIPDGSAKGNIDGTQSSVDKLSGNWIDVLANGNVPDGTAKPNIDNTQGAIDSMSSKSVEANVTGNVLDGIASTIWDVVSAIGNLASKTISVGVNWFNNGDGGPRKAGGIRWHAAGAIVNAPHHGYPLDMVGEAGAEAIVPLTNRRYAQPFIDMIGDNLVTKLGVGAGSVTNIYFNGNRINDNPQIREVTKDYMIQLKRLGAM